MSTGQYLSAEELMKYFGSSLTELPQRGGQKEYSPDGSWLQAKTLQHCYQQRRDVLSEERVKKKAHLCRADWRPEKGKVEAAKNVGKFWKTVGHVQDGRFYLHPEEALSLLEKGDLEIYHGGIPLSVQEAYTTVLSNNVPLEHYQVYNHLSRLGYIISRHDKSDMQYTAYEQKLGLGRKRSGKDKKGKKKRKAGSDADIPAKLPKIQGNQDGLRNIEDAAKMDCDGNVEVDKRDNSDLCLQPDTSTSSFKSSIHQISNETDAVSVATSSDTRCREWNSCSVFNQKESKQILRMANFADISIPDLSVGSLDLGCPDPACLPPGVSLVNDTYHATFHLYHRNTFSNYPSNEDCSLGCVTLSSKVKATNWADYKKQKSEQNCIDLLASPAGHLWKGEVQPLIKPQQATRTGSILERLKIIQNLNFNEKSANYSDSISSTACFVYDVHFPNASFSKTNPGPPAFCLCITRQDEPVPCLADMVHVSRHCPDGATVQWAVVDNGDITFYSFNGIDLPQDIVVH